ncbi:unnamed protein product [Aphanomyces euteiches]
MQKDSLYVRFAAGAVASASAEMATLPVDISKVRLQAQGMGALGAPQPRYTGMFNTIGRIATEEGVGALWKGARPAVARQLVYSSMCMVLYEPFRDAIMTLQGTSPDIGGMSFAQKLMAGGMAGALSISIANPVDVIKVRMQADRTGDLYRGLTDAMIKIHRDEGMQGFLKGVGPNVARGFIVNAAELGVYDQVVDVIKTRLMTQPAGEAAIYKGIGDCASRTFREEGLRAFYKGFIPNWMRKAPWCVVFFVSYEECRSMMTQDEPLNAAFALPHSQKKL